MLFMASFGFPMQKHAFVFCLIVPLHLQQICDSVCSAEAMGHLNEAGMAANVGAKIPSDPDLPIEVAYTNGHPEPVPQTPEIPPVSPG